MLEMALDKIAEQIIELDEASLTHLRKKYLDKVFDFKASKEWEKAVVIYFIINGVIAKNDLFNRHILDQQTEGARRARTRKQKGETRKKLRIVK